MEVIENDESATKKRSTIPFLCLAVPLDPQEGPFAVRDFHLEPQRSLGH